MLIFSSYLTSLCLLLPPPPHCDPVSLPLRWELSVVHLLLPWGQRFLASDRPFSCHPTLSPSSILPPHLSCKLDACSYLLELVVMKCASNTYLRRTRREP